MTGETSSLADPRTAAMAMAGLSILFALKHYVADFLFQNNWVAKGKERPVGWGVPLLVHVMGHTGITLMLVLIMAPRLWWLAGIDFGVHLATDRAKTLINRSQGWKPDQVQFWWLLGLDQFIHQVTNIALALAVVLL